MRAVAVLVGAFLLASSGIAQGKSADTLTARGKIARASVLLKEAKKALMDQGAYNCCIKAPGCDKCALDHQSCDCATDVKQGKAVCSDCYAGWKRGDGIVPDVNPNKVKLSSHGHKH
ncbi:MAG: hypothetical protein AB1428_02625 [Bacteroidota bacterium]